MAGTETTDFRHGVPGDLARRATAGVMLLRDGTTRPVPDLATHGLLRRGTSALRLAHDALAAGQVHRSFLWPVAVDGDQDHVGVTVLATSDVSGLALGIVLVTPHADRRGLTPRELQVLGLVVDGCSNQQVAHRLTITPRTVATHVEHILVKLEVACRTLAAVHAEREGCYVPAAALDAG